MSKQSKKGIGAGKRILYLLPQPFLSARGSSFRALATVKAITALGFEVDLVSYPIGKDVSDVSGLNVIRWRSIPAFKSIKIGPSYKKFLMDIPLFLKGLQLAASGKYDLIHGPEEAGIMACCYHKIFKTPYIYDMHSWMSQQIEEAGFVRSKFVLKMFKKIEHYCMQRALAIITVGPSMTEILKELAPNVPAFTLKDCSLDIANEVDLDLKNNFVSTHHLADKKVFLYTGNFEIYQGIDLLLESFVELKKILPENSQKLSLVLVGGGAGQEENLLKYKKMVSDLALEGNVIFAGEWPVEKMPTFMDIAHVLVSPRTQGNNVPLKVYTYMAAGKISVVTDIDSHTQVLNSGNSIVATANPIDFANGLAKAIDANPETISDIIERINAAQKAGESRADQIEFKQVVENCYSLL